MAVISITNTAVVGNGLGTNQTSGEALAAGDLVYKDTADGNKVKKADNTTAAKALVFGMCLNDAPAANMPVSIITAGKVTVGSVLGGIGHTFVISGTAGKMEDINITTTPAPTTGDFVTYIGTSDSATVLDLNIDVSGLAFT